MESLAERWRWNEGEDVGIEIESLLVDTRGQSRVEALGQAQSNTLGVGEVFKVRRRRVEGLEQAG